MRYTVNQGRSTSHVVRAGRPSQHQLARIDALPNPRRRLILGITQPSARGARFRPDLARALADQLQVDVVPCAAREAGRLAGALRLQCAGGGWPADVRLEPAECAGDQGRIDVWLGRVGIVVAG